MGYKKDMLKVKLFVDEYKYLYINDVDSIVDKFDEYKVVLRNDEYEYEFDAYCDDIGMVSDMTAFEDRITCSGAVWRLYLKCIKGDDVVLYRLKGKLPSVADIDFDGSNSQMILDRGRHIGVIASKEIDGNEIDALVYMSRGSGKFSVQEVHHDKCEHLINGEWKLFTGLQEDEYAFKFSVVMAVYNEEKNLHESINSIIDQTIGFEENVQLILCDDGSIDGSGRICDHYRDMYPDNIIVIHKENGGVATARNAGLEKILGKYVNFCDADDKFSNNAFENVWKFFEDNYESVDVVTIPIYFFGTMEGPHWQNYKFNGKNRCVDLWKEYAVSDMFVNCSFIKHKAAVENEFDPALPVSEDSKYLIKILLEKMKLGIVDNCQYLYRKSDKEENSLVASAKKKKAWYQEYFTNYVLWAKQYAIDKYGFVPYWIQNTLMMDLQWRLRMEEIPEGVLDEEETDNYVTLLKKVLSEMDDEIIVGQRKIFREHKMQLFGLKENAKLYKRYIDKDLILYSGNTEVGRMSTLQTRIDHLEIRGNALYLAGYNVVYDDEAVIHTVLEVNGKFYNLNNMDRDVSTYNILGKLRNAVAFEGQVTIEDSFVGKPIKLCVIVDNHLVSRTNLFFGKFCPIGNEYKGQYYYKNDYVIRHRDNGLLITRCFSYETLLGYERIFIEELKSNNVKDWGNIQKLRRKVIDYKLRPHKSIWLISDKADRADDNGEAFFKYVVEQKNKDIIPYFVISDKCEDAERIRRYGRVVSHMSDEAKYLHLCAECVISAHSHHEIENPFLDDLKYYRDFISDKHFVFLQHGIIKDDMSEGLNRFVKRYSIFVTSTKSEQDSIINGKYYYNSDEVLLSGLPRYDLLYSDTKKIISIMPTWRHYLCGNFNPQNDFWELLPGFKESEYYEFYSSLLNNNRLLESAKRYGYQLQYLPHPVFFAHQNLFAGISKDVKILGKDCVYRDIYAESSLVVTDYSSAVMDFAYLRKPVVYAHFDADEFFGNHYKKGYFDYERDGFGEVEYTLDSLVDRIIEYMENGCVMKDMYKKRCDEFFEFDDRRNCERVYDAILKLPRFGDKNE